MTEETEWHVIATNEDSEATSEDTIEETSEDSSDDTKEDTSDDPATSENASEDTDRLTRPAHKLIPCQEHIYSCVQVDL